MAAGGLLLLPGRRRAPSRLAGGGVAQAPIACVGPCRRRRSVAVVVRAIAAHTRYALRAYMRWTS